MRAVLAIAGVDLRRMLRDRSNLFFVFVFPLLLVLLIGVQFGGGVRPELALHVPDDAGPLAEELADDLAALDLFDVVPVPDGATARDRVEDGTAAIGIVIPPGYDVALAAGEDVQIGTVQRQDGAAVALATAVRGAVARRAATITAARAAAETSGGSFADALAVATAAAATVPGVEVETRRLGEPALAEFSGLGQFDLGASSQLLLFVFLTSLSGSAALIQARQLGLTRRMLATPTSAVQVLVGQAAGRFAVALTQALYIVLGTLVVFDVNWGNPLGAGAVIFAFCLVSTGAAMLMGAVFSNDAQASGMGVFIGLGLAAIGGSMAPLEVFPDTVRRVAHLVTPHAWANDAFAVLVRRGGGVEDILTELGVLTAAAVALLGLAAYLLHRASLRPT